jgi:hypothetical protein
MATDSTFNYEVDKDCDYIFDERGNTVLALRKVSWGGRDAKLELRRWRVDIEKETPDKGFTFLTEQGPHNLVKTLIDNGFGNTREILEGIKNREDFRPLITKVLKGEDLGVPLPEVPDDEEYYDPKEFLLG